MSLVTRALVLCLAVLALCALLPRVTRASPPSIGSFGLFKHTGWTEDDGAPAPIGSVVRGADGYIYVTSARSGFYRFDGYSFEKMPDTDAAASRHASTSLLLVSREGDLWVGYQQGGGVGVLRHGRMQDTGMKNPPPSITEFAQTTDGAVWAAYGGRGRRLWRYENGTWQCMDLALSLPDGFITSIVASPSGTLWLSLNRPYNTSGVLFSLPVGATRLQQQPDTIFFGGLGFDPRGRLWVVDRLGIRILRDTSGRPPTRPTVFSLGVPLLVARFAFDSAGALWGTTRAGNIFRIASAGDAFPSGPVDLYNASDGLTSDYASDVVSDREANIWVATAGGLDRFRREAGSRAPSIPADPQVGIGIARAKNGVVYVTSSGQLFVIAPHQAPRPIKAGLGGDRLLCAAQDGGIWISGLADVTHILGSVVTTFPQAKAAAAAGVGNCAEDRLGRLWIGTDRGIFWHDETGWHQLGGHLDTAFISATVLDQRGNAVFVIDHSAVGIMDGAKFKIFDDKVLGAGTIASISIGRRDIFVSGDRALVRLRDASVAHIDVARIPFVDHLRNLVQTAAGSTWMMGVDGLSRVSTADLDRAFENRLVPLNRRLFNFKDGLPGTWQHIGYAGQQCAEGLDGRLWFITASGVVSIDPGNLPKNPVPPVLAIESFTANGKVYSGHDDVRLPPGTSTLDISFVALSLVDPQRNQYRYLLDGLETSWIDPGQRRDASYANLGPGRYVFHLRASNNDGVWSNDDAILSFVIEPTFMQTAAFKLLCTVLVLSLVWFAYTLRLGAMTARVRLGMEERLLERERIARELHDTLLQAISGLMLRFEVASRAIPGESQARLKIEQALNLADQVIAEGRDRVRDLRADSPTSSFEMTIRDTMNALPRDDDLTCDVSVGGTPRRLDPVARGEAMSIVRESLVNAVRHAHASRISVVTKYTKANFEVSVSDDGIGIDYKLLEHGQRDGHYGLPGMRERARKLGGTLILERLAKGTRVTLRIPGAVAFKNSSRDAGSLSGKP
jgi:signal transduction histidine kinase/ligand-binding sensor domain-containing protein